jgi:hypothetical protein
LSDAGAVVSRFSDLEGDATPPAIDPPRDALLCTATIPYAKPSRVQAVSVSTHSVCASEARSSSCNPRRCYEPRNLASACGKRRESGTVTLPSSTV